MAPDAPPPAQSREHEAQEEKRVAELEQQLDSDRNALIEEMRRVRTKEAAAELEKPEPMVPSGAEPEPEPEPEPELEPQVSPGPHYTSCYELTYVMLDKHGSPNTTALRQLVWLPEPDSPCPSKVLVMIIYPTWQPNSPISLLDDMVTMALGSPFTNPIDVPIQLRRNGSAGSSPGASTSKAGHELGASQFGLEQETISTESNAGQLHASAGIDEIKLELDRTSKDGTCGDADDIDDGAFHTPTATRNDSEWGREAKVARASSSVSPPNLQSAAQSDDGSISPVPSIAERTASGSSLPMLSSNIGQRGTEWATHRFTAAVTHVTGQIEKYAERKMISRRVPFSGVVVFEVDWDQLTGFEYWNQPVQEGRMCMEINRMRKCRFSKVEHAVQYYKLQPTPECARRCGLGLERDPRSEIYNQPELLPDEQRLKRQNVRMSMTPEGISWRYIAWPTLSTEDDSLAQRSCAEPNISVKKQLLCQSSEKSCSDGGSRLHFGNANANRKGKDEERVGSLAAEPKVDPVFAQMLAIYFTCPFLPGAAGRLMLRPERSKVLRNYEAGLPAWAVNLATNRFVPNLPIIGVWYRPRMRTLLTAVVIVVQVISMICGFYDLWRNIPFIQPTLILICTPIYNWLVGPLTSVLSSFFTSIFSTVVTKGLASLVNAIYHAFSFVLAPVVSAMFMAFQPLVTLFAPLAALSNTLLRTARTCANVILAGPRVAVSTLVQLLRAGGTLLWPLFDVLTIFVKAFGGLISGLVAFPFQLLITLLRPLIALGALMMRVLSTSVDALRRLMGFGATSANVVNTVSTVQKLQNLWTTVLRPIKAVVKSVYDSVMMVSTKLLKHRLTLERLIDSKRSESRIVRVVISREAMIAVGGLSAVVAFESILAELIGLLLLAFAATAVSIGKSALQAPSEAADDDQEPEVDEQDAEPSDRFAEQDVTNADGTGEAALQTVSAAASFEAADGEQESEVDKQDAEPSDRFAEQDVTNADDTGEAALQRFSAAASFEAADGEQESEVDEQDAEPSGIFEEQDATLITLSCRSVPILC